MSRCKEVFNAYLKDLIGAMLEDVAYNDNTRNTRADLKRRDIYLIVYDILVNETRSDWYTHAEFRTTIEETRKREDFRPEKASEAFSHIEQYILFILLMPWKQEYRRIKKYCGFYQNAIENSLSKAEVILNLVGFSETKRGVLVLTKLPSPEQLKYIAFECFVASTEMRIIADSWEKAKLSLQSKMKHIYGDSHTPEVGGGKYNVIIQGNVADGRTTDSVPGYISKPIDRSSTEHYRTKLNELLKQAQKLDSADNVNTDLPFVDVVSKQSMDFEEGTLEDHVKASLQIVENNESTPTAFVEPLPRNISASQEWSFVRDNLKQKYGNQYFEGPRKDILTAEDDDKDNNVIKHKPRLHPVKFGDNPWSEQVVLTRDGRLPERQVQDTRIEGQVLHSSVNDSAYQSGLQAQFPPSISSENLMSRSASAAYSKKFDTDVILKKPNIQYQSAPVSHTAPIARRSSAPVPKEDASPTKSYSKMPFQSGNEQGVDTLRNSQKTLLKESSVEKVPLHHPSVASMVSGGRSSGVGDSLSSRGYMGKSSGRSLIIRRNESDSYTTTASAQMPNHWHCTNCTYLNDCSSNICKMCSKTRDGQVDMDSPSVGSTSKVCDKCTLENDIHSSVCQACGNALGGSQTVV